MVGVAKEDRVNHGMDIKEWTGQTMSSLLRIADYSSQWAVITVEASVGVSQRRLGIKGIS